MKGIEFIDSLMEENKMSSEELVPFLENILNSSRYEGFGHFDPLEDSDDFLDDIDAEKKFYVITPSGERLNNSETPKKLNLLRIGNPSQIEAIKAWEYMMAHRCLYGGY